MSNEKRPGRDANATTGALEGADTRSLSIVPADGPLWTVPRKRARRVAAALRSWGRAHIEDRALRSVHGVTTGPCRLFDGEACAPCHTPDGAYYGYLDAKYDRDHPGRSS